MSQEALYGTGRRKNAVARVWLRPGGGRFVVNDKDLGAYFPVAALEIEARQPLEITNTAGRFDVLCRVTGGGVAGQAEAIRHGLARALLHVDREFRTVLKKAGLLTRDPRVKERRKYGLKKARKAPQFSKR